MANNRIKGLTVEIGGDTTKLGQALASVDKRSRNLSAELDEINRLLKFDPDNAELLAQRQKVLAEAIANTTEELEILNEAERQVQEQFARGEIAEEQMRALQREILKAKNRLKEFQDQANETGDETEDTGEEAEEAGDAFEIMGAKVANAAKNGLLAIVSAATAAVTALVASAESTREYRTEMGKLETAFTTAGHSSEAATATYQALQGVLGETEQAVEAANHLAMLASNEAELAKWTDIATGVYATFGASLPIEGLTEAANETAKTGALTGALADALNWAGVNEEQFQAQLDACSTEQERQALITETLSGLYGEAAEAYRETNAEIIRANEANEAWMSTMAEAGASVEPIITDVKMLGASLLSELMPGITGVTDAFRGLVNGEDGAATAVGEALSNLITQVVDKAVELVPTLVETVLSLVTSVATALVEALPQIVDTIIVTLVNGIPLLLDGAVQLLLALLDAIPLIIPSLIEAIPQIVVTLIDGLLAAIPQLLDGAVQFLMAIIDAIPILISKLLPYVPSIVDTIVDGLLDSIPTLIDGAITLLFGILDAIPEIQAAIYKEMPRIVTSIIDALLRAIPQLIAAGGQLIGGLIKGMLNFDIGGALSKIGDGIISGFKKVFDIHSPSRVMEGIGEMLDEGLAVGITDNAETPVNALDKLSEDMIESTSGMNGISMERRMVHAFNPSTAGAPTDGIAGKLDQIYKAILAGQVIMLDGKTLVGSTAVQYDTQLGQRRVLAERGAL